MSKRKNKVEPEQDVNAKITALLGRRKGPRESKEELIEKRTKFIQEFKEDGKLVSRWTYDLKKFANGPILVENFEDDSEKKSWYQRKKEGLI